MWNKAKLIKKPTPNAKANEYLGRNTLIHGIPRMNGTSPRTNINRIQPNNYFSPHFFVGTYCKRIGLSECLYNHQTTMAITRYMVITIPTKTLLSTFISIQSSPFLSGTAITNDTIMVTSPFNHITMGQFEPTHHRMM